MALETATYISDLVSTNPTASDNISQGDDHIRLLKSSIKATFPNITGAVTPTHTELNYVDGVTSAIQTQLDAKAPASSPTLSGTVTINGTVTGTGISGYLASPPAIGSGTPSTGAFTTLSATGNVTFSGTGATIVQVGTTAQRPTAATGMIRYNSSLTTFEGYNGTAWGAIGGGAQQDVFYENAKTVSSNYSITSNKNAMSTGPITISSGVTVTIPSNSRWVIL